MSVQLLQIAQLMVAHTAHNMSQKISHKTSDNIAAILPELNPAEFAINLAAGTISIKKVPSAVAGFLEDPKNIDINSGWTPLPDTPHSNGPDAGTEINYAVKIGRQYYNPATNNNRITIVEPEAQAGAFYFVWNLNSGQPWDENNSPPPLDTIGSRGWIKIENFAVPPISLIARFYLGPPALSFNEPALGWRTYVVFAGLTDLDGGTYA